jgi:hypothetical protein
MTSTILATFDRVDDAHRAIQDLTDSGFKRGDIGLALHDKDNVHDKIATDDDVSGGEGASFGATMGGVLGAVVGLGAIAIPGIGPIIAAGPLAAALGALAGAAVGATAGAVTGGVTASLLDMGVSEEDAHYYAESVRRGAALVSVTVHEVDRERAAHILERHNPIDIDSRVAQWKARGWEGFDPMADPYVAEPLADTRPTGVRDTDEDFDVDEDDYRRAVREYPRP